MRKQKIQKLHSTHRRLILDYAAGIPLKQQPRKMSEVDSLLNAFRETEPESFKEAYDIIVLKKIPNATDNSAIVASKVVDLVEPEIDRLKNWAIADSTNKIVDEISGMKDQLTEHAKEEIEKAKKEFYQIKIKVGNKNAKKIKGIICEEFNTLLELAQMRMNIMMVGPSGAGKTHIAGQIADALDLDFASQSCSAGMSESQLTGWLLPIEKNGVFKYVSSEFIRIYENGGVFLFDEIDASDPNVLIFINQALANGKFTLPQRYENPVIEKHPDFIAIAAANTFGSGADAMYHARNALDAATIDRFKMGMVQIDYSDSVEQRIVKDNVLQWGKRIRRIIEHHGIRKIMSTRVMRDASTMIEGQSWSMEKVAKTYFSDWTKEELLIVTRDFPDALSPNNSKEERTWT